MRRVDLERKLKFTNMYRAPQAGYVNAKALKELIKRYVTKNTTVIVPFMGKLDYLPEILGENNKLITNDIDFAIDADYQMDALDFLSQCPKTNSSLVIATIPLEIQTELRWHVYLGRLRRAIDNLITKGCHVITIDTNTNGEGFQRGYVPVEILNMFHGTLKYNTLVLVEKKLKTGQLPTT